MDAKREAMRSDDPDIVKVSIEELAPGQYVSHVGMETPDGAVAPVGRAMLNMQEIGELRKSGASVAYVDPEKSVGLRLKGADSSRAADKTSPPTLVDLMAARSLYVESVACARNLMEEARAGAGVDASRVQPFVDGVIRSVLRDHAALFSILKLKNYDEYTFTHGVNVCTLAVIFGRQLGYGGEALRELGLAAFLHDVGKAAIPLHVLNKPGPLTDEEFRVMKTHAVAGFKMLTENNAISRNVAMAALEHHERGQGGGYPRGAPEEKINSMARIVGLCDVYDAMTSDRCYRRAMPPADVLARLYSWRGKDFGADHVERFIKCVGVYPEGSFVRLKDGRVAMVARNNAEQLLHPMVRVFITADGAICRPQLVDLGERRDDAASRIVGAFDPKEYGLDVSELMGLTG